MKYYLILLPAFFVLALFQGAVSSLNLVLLLLLLLLLTQPDPNQLAWLAFISGLLLDLAKGISLGFSSLLFLIFVFLFLAYQRQLKAAHPFFISGFVFLTAVVYSRLALSFWHWRQALILAVLAFFLRPLFLFWYSPKGGKRLKF